MKRLALRVHGFHFVAVAILAAWALAPVHAHGQTDGAARSETNYLNQPLVEDWSTRHVVFSNPGTLENAQRNGREEQWRRIVGDPRYRMQWVKRYAASAGLRAMEPTSVSRLSASAQQDPTFDMKPIGRRIDGPGPMSSLQGDWTVALGSSLASVAIGAYPAKYTFAPIGIPSCTADFVVFPVNKAGQATQQANIMGASNLYATTCTGSVPNIKFSYFVGTGIVQTSPTLSLDGTKVAFVETVTNGSILHVLKIGTTGNNGTAFNSAVAPGSGNNAVDTRITMSGSVTDSNSGPFVDYSNDIAYVGDDKGFLHKFTGVFLGTPGEASGNWPVQVNSQAPPVLTAPVYDSISTNIFVGGSLGNIRCVSSAGTLCSSPFISVAAGTSPGPVLDAPIVDSTNQKVYATASNSTNSVLLQATTSLSAGTAIRANMGVNGTDLYNGAFDNTFLSSTGGTGFMYFCGNGASSAVPTLLRIAITSGTMSSTHDTNAFTLATTAGTASDCTPLTEVLNGTTDYLFLGVKDNGFVSGTPNCAGNTCIMSFRITSSFPAGGPLQTTHTNLGSAGISGIIIDNVSTATGASQIYFGSLQTSTGVQASQSTLQ